MFTYKTKGTCSKEIVLDIDHDIIQDVTFIYGCPGNTAGISRLVKGRHIDEIIPLLRGVDCGGRGTSCPDQLAQALIDYKVSKVLEK